MVKCNLEVNVEVFEDKSKFLIKSTAAVHVSGSLNILQRKIFNIFLLRISKNSKIEGNNIYSISFMDLKKEIGYEESTSFSDDFKKMILDLSQISLTWNILRKNKKIGIVSSSILQFVEIKEGVIKYSFSSRIVTEFLNPSIYAKLDLNVQKNLKANPSVILWEFLTEELCSKKSDVSKTDWLEIEKIKEITDSVDKNYSYFKRNILLKSIKEINEKAAINVDFEEKKGSRGRVSHLKFFVEIKEKRRSEKVSMEVEKSRLKAFGFNNTFLNDVFSNYCEEKITSAIDYYEYSIKKNMDIKNPVAYFLKILKEGWFVPKLIVPLVEKDLKEPDFSHESDNCQLVRKHLEDEIGIEVYKDWFLEVKLIENEGKLILKIPNLFTLKYLKDNYSYILDEIISKCGYSEYIFQSS